MNSARWQPPHAREPGPTTTVEMPPMFRALFTIEDADWTLGSDRYWFGRSYLPALWHDSQLRVVKFGYVALMWCSYSNVWTSSLKSTVLMSIFWNEWMAWTYESIERDCISRC